MAKSIDVIEADLKFFESDSEEETLNVDAVEATKRASRTGVTSGQYNPQNSVLESMLANVPESVTQGRIGTYNFVVPGLSEPLF